MDSTTDQLYPYCNACGGTGYQQNIETGIRELCPLCEGSGKRYIGPTIEWISD